jgi:hypothetical protein
MYLRLIILSVEGDIPVDSKELLITDFVNLKIKPTQYFKDAHNNRIYIYIYL